MAKVSSKDIVAKIKREKALAERDNATFRLNKALMDRFRAKCEAQGVSMAAVLEELIASYLE